MVGCWWDPEDESIDPNLMPPVDRLPDLERRMGVLHPREQRLPIEAADHRRIATEQEIEREEMRAAVKASWTATAAKAEHTSTEEFLQRLFAEEER